MEDNKTPCLPKNTLFHDRPSNRIDRIHLRNRRIGKNRECGRTRELPSPSDGPMNKKKKKRGKGRKKTFFSRVEKRELIWKPGRAGNNRHPQDRRVFSFSFWTWIQFEFERIRTMFDRASTNFHASDSGRPEFRNDDRLFQCGRIFRPRYKSVFSFYRSFFFFPFSLNFFFFHSLTFDQRTANGGGNFSLIHNNFTRIVFLSEPNYYYIFFFEMKNDVIIIIIMNEGIGNVYMGR